MSFAYEFESVHFSDENGMPAGGSAHGVGLNVRWQQGPLGRGDDRQAPNGTFVETVIGVALDRLMYYQGTQFACDENAEAIEHLRGALDACARRTAAREQRGVEGTHAV